VKNDKKRISNYIITNYNSIIGDKDNIYKYNKFIKLTVDKDSSKDEKDIIDNYEYVSGIISNINSTIKKIKTVSNNIYENKETKENNVKNNKDLVLIKDNITGFIEKINRKKFFDIKDSESISDYIFNNSEKDDIYKYIEDNELNIDITKYYDKTSNSAFLIFGLIYIFLHKIVCELIDLNDNKIDIITDEFMDNVNNIDKIAKYHEDIYINSNANKVYNSLIIDNSLSETKANLNADIKDVDKIIFILLTLYLIIIAVLYLIRRKIKS
jgi:hypothetical protein